MSLRKKLKLQAGARLKIQALDEDSAVILKHPDNYTRNMRELGKDIWRKLGGAESYLKKERTSWRKR